MHVTISAAHAAYSQAASSWNRKTFCQSSHYPAAADAQRDPEAVLRLIVTHQGPDEIHARFREQVQAIEQFDRQDIAWLLAASELGPVQVFLVGKLGRRQLAAGDVDFVLCGSGFGERRADLVTSAVDRAESLGDRLADLGAAVP